MHSHEKNLINFNNLSVDKLKSLYKIQKALILELNDRTANLDKNELNFYNCFEYDMEVESKYLIDFCLSSFEGIHPDLEIRKKSGELNKELSEFGIEQTMRMDVFEVINHYYMNQYQEESKKLSQEQCKYVENTIINYKKMGLGLDEEKREIVKSINKKISAYSSDYNSNLSEIKTEFEFELKDLEGMDMDWLSNRLVENSKYRIKLQYPDFVPIMEYCKNRQTRKLMIEAMGSRCIDTNLPILLDTIKLRKEKAELFGFDSHTNYSLQNMMAKNSNNVMDFLNKLLDMIKPLVQTDLEQLNKLAYELDNLEKIESYDKAYYSRIYTEKMSGLNKADLKKMFSIDSVTTGIFNIYQEILNLKFIDITNLYPNSIYSPDVKLFCVYDGIDVLLSNPMGYFYLDLFPREGKYSHAAMFTFLRKSKYNLPICAIVCNFDAKLDIDYDNVVTYFHEFGHLMHNMTSQNEIPSLSGTACQRDFVETPSQMFEEWCSYMEPLQRLVKPEYIQEINFELINKINKQNKQLQGIFNAGQLAYALLDQSIHSANIPENTWEFYNHLVKDLFGWEISPTSNVLANWSHMFGYDSLYYGYLWSKVYAIDLFSFFKSNQMDKEMGKRLREEILSKGGTLDGLDLLRNFMGREPNPNAYIEWLGNDN